MLRSLGRRLTAILAISGLSLSSFALAASAEEPECSDPAVDSGEEVFVRMSPTCDHDGTEHSPGTTLVDPVQPDGPFDPATCTLTAAFALDSRPDYGTDLASLGTLNCDGDVSRMKLFAVVQRKENGTWTDRGTVGSVESSVVVGGGFIQTHPNNNGEFACGSTTWRRYRAKTWGNYTTTTGQVRQLRPRVDGPWAGRCKKA